MHFRSSLLSLRNLNIYHHLYWAKFQVFVANMVAGYCPIFEHLYQRSLPTEELLDSQMKVFSCWNKADLQAGKYTFSSDLVRGVHLCMSFKRQSCEMQETRAAAQGGTWVFFGWVCAPRDSKLAPRSKKNSPKIDTPF